METSESGRVIVGISDTVAGYQALRYAVAQARERGVPLIAVRTYSCGPTNAQWRDVLVKGATEYVVKVFAEALGCQPAGTASEITLCEGAAGRALVLVADNARDLVVVGGSGSRRWTGLRRAAVAKYCSRHASCPVVIVPPPALARR
ncbi:MAG TPA: universal stress protein, partial [Micromonosporaceae bacterium]